MEYGWVMLLVLAVMGGIIAYIGDKLGSKIHPPHRVRCGWRADGRHVVLWS